MKSLNDVFSAFKLNKSKVNSISKEVKEAAVTLESDGEEQDLPRKTSSILLDITDKIWVSSRRVVHNISLNFKAYEVFPHAYFFQYPLFAEIMRQRIADPVQLEIVWKQLVKYLSSEDGYANPVRHTLWNYYFKDERTVKTCWQGLINAQPDRTALVCIISEAACVPWDLKEPVYYSLLDDKENHEEIFYSLYNSAFAEGGKINNEKAYNLLKKLAIKRYTVDFWNLSRKINAKHRRQHPTRGKSGTPTS